AALAARGRVTPAAVLRRIQSRHLVRAVPGRAVGRGGRIMRAAGDPRAAHPAAGLRAEFDRGFALAPSAGGADGLEGHLAIRVGGDSCAPRLADLLGVYVDRKIVPLPSSVPTLLGIASFRGVLIPVHDLRLLLGYP